MQFQDLFKKVESYTKNPALIKKAYLFAEKIHSNHNRINNEPYIQHPLNVAYILAELKLDENTISAALLHDTIKDENVSYELLSKEFNSEVSKLIQSVALIKTIKNLPRDDYQAETIRKVILSSVKDIRVIIIKLADRLHNLRTIDILPEEKRKKIAQDILQIYAPIAHKLGIASIKWELEDLAFKQLQPEIYNEILFKLKRTQLERDKELEFIKLDLEKELKNYSISFEIIGRSKHIYSIYKKMLKKDHSFEEVLDLVALRIITDTIPHCYELIGIVHNFWSPVNGRFKDYIASPKSNLYQSLHTVVIGPTNKPVEIQIRTKDMHEIAESGIAAHWKYKGISEDKRFDQKLKWMLELNELKKDSPQAKEIMKLLEIDLFDDEIFTFTPKGKIISLPQGATIIDFAYAVHSELGDKCIAAKVNGNFVPLRAQLKNSDIIEIIISKTQHPSRDWLKFVITSKATSKIKKYLLENSGLHANVYRTSSNDRKELEELIIKVPSIQNPRLSLSKCCKPLPGDRISGLLRSTDKVAIHKSDCNIIKKVPQKKRVIAQWLDKISNNILLKVDAQDRKGLFTEILNNLIAFSIPVKQAKTKPTGDDFIECSFAIEINNLKHLQELIQRVRKINGIRNVFIDLKK